MIHAFIIWLAVVVAWVWCVRIIVSFDVGEQVVPGGISGWLAMGFQSAEATFNRGVIPAISLPAHGLDHPGGAENLAVIGGGVLAAAI